jgi:hypothetical protein
VPAPHAPGGLIATPRQLSIIAVLGAMLAGVLIVQFGGASASPEPSASAGGKLAGKAATAAARPIEAPARPAASARNQRETVALVGDCPVHVGDVIEGYRVRSIDAGGVLLVPCKGPDARRAPKR